MVSERNKTKKYIFWIVIGIFVLSTIGYASYEVQKVLFGPKIIVLSPIDGSLISSSTTEISGITKNIKELSLNDRKIFTDEEGNFKEEMLLSYGYNIFILKASDKFGRNTEEKIELIYK
jgi:hypothetical protein